MPGLFSSDWANRLTQLSGHYLDFSRVGNLVGSHRYSRKELLDRGFIIASMALGTAAGVTMSDHDDGTLQRGLWGMAGCFVSFVLSHAIVIVPLVVKRRQRANLIKQHEASVANLLDSLKSTVTEENVQDDLEAFIGLVGEQLHKAKTLNLSDEKHSKASLTWGTRLRCMGIIAESLEKDVATLQKDSDQLAILLEKWKSMTPTAEQPVKEHDKESADAVGNLLIPTSEPSYLPTLG